MSASQTEKSQRTVRRPSPSVPRAPTCEAGGRFSIFDLPLAPARLPNRESYHTVAQHQHGASTHMPINLWQPGLSGNPAGRPRGSRNALSEEVICALLRDFRKHGEKAIAKVRRDQPGVYLRCLTLLIPREHKVEQSNVIKSLSDQELEAMIEYIKTSLEAQADRPVKVIDGTIEPISVEVQRGPLLHSPKPKNKVMLEAGTAVGPRERKPRKREGGEDE